MDEPEISALQARRLLGAERRKAPRASDVPKGHTVTLSPDETLAVLDSLMARKREFEALYPAIGPDVRRLFESYVVDIDSVLEKIPK